MDNNSNIKIHPIWYICVIVRTIIAALPLIYNNLINKDYKETLIKTISLFNKYFLILIGIGFLIKSIFGSNDEKQIDKVFWHKTRIIHAFLIFMAGIHFYNYYFSSVLLFTDIFFSIIYRLISKHFKNTY